MENRLVVAKGRKGDGGMDWEFRGWQIETITYRMDEQQGPTV